MHSPRLLSFCSQKKCRNTLLSCSFQKKKKKTHMEALGHGKLNRKLKHF